MKYVCKIERYSRDHLIHDVLAGTSGRYIFKDSVRLRDLIPSSIYPSMANHLVRNLHLCKTIVFINFEKDHTRYIHVGIHDYLTHIRPKLILNFQEFKDKIAVKEMLGL